LSAFDAAHRYAHSAAYFVAIGTTFCSTFDAALCKTNLSAIKATNWSAQFFSIEPTFFRSVCTAFEEA
jgi:hypothetical protein